MYVYNIETKAPFVLPTFAEKFYLYGVPLWRRNVYNTDKQTCNLKSSLKNPNTFRQGAQQILVPEQCHYFLKNRNTILIYTPKQHLSSLVIQNH